MQKLTVFHPITKHSLNINFYELLMSLRSISSERQFAGLCTKILWNFGELVW